MDARWVLLALVAIAGCTGAPPTGQVVARVNGVEITRRDILIELVARGAPADVDTRKIQPELLDQIIVRKLLAAEARRRLIDRSPEFVGEERRDRELLLGKHLLQRMVGTLPPPTQKAVARYVANARGARGDVAQQAREAASAIRDVDSRLLIDRTIRQLRADAHIEYQGDDHRP